MSTPGKVGVVFVSHSGKIAEGLVELARQMAPTASLIAAGGTDDGRIGTSFDLVSSGITEADAAITIASGTTNKHFERFPRTSIVALLQPLLTFAQV